MNTLFSRVGAWLRYRSPEMYCRVVDLGLHLRGKPLRIMMHGGLFRLEFKPRQDVDNKNSEEIWLVTPIRLYKYIDGLNSRLKRLAKIYFLDRVPLRPGDTVVDCGANIGEIGLWLARQHEDIKYFAVEPGPKEGVALRRNLPDATHDAMALWSEDGDMKLFLEPETADSSLSDQGSGAETVTIKTCQLGTYLHCNGIDHVRLLKIEAEGSEPEVLAGAASVLDRVDYIAVDMGPEREGCYNTVQACVTLLSTAGFNFLAYDHRRHTGLFSRIEANPFKG